MASFHSQVAVILRQRAKRASDLALAIQATDFVINELVDGLKASNFPIELEKSNDPDNPLWTVKLTDVVFSFDLEEVNSRMNQSSNSDYGVEIENLFLVKLNEKALG